MRLNRNDCEQNLKKLIDSLDSGWLKNQLDEIKKIEESKNPIPHYEKKFNPLAFRIAKAQQHLEICKKDATRIITEEVLRVVSLGLDISKLTERKVVGLDRKIKLLMGDNLTTDQLDQIIYEISIANTFSSKGCQVEFVKESTQKDEQTPDLMVNNIEVECTKKDSQTDRDKRNEMYWQNLGNKLNKLMDSHKTNYCIFIETQEDPTDDVIKMIFKKCSDLISKCQEGSFMENGFEMKLKKTFDFDIDIPSSLLASDVQSWKTSESSQEIRNLLVKKIGNSELIDKIFDEKDHSILTFPCKFQKGWAVFKNIRAAGFSSKILPDRIKSIENRLLKKRYQLSNTRAGIIFLELDYQTATQIQSDITRLEKIITNYLDNNSRVSAVVITVEGYPVDQEKISYYRNAIVIKNKSPGFHLPENFDEFLNRS